MNLDFFSVLFFVQSKSMLVVR